MAGAISLVAVFLVVTIEMIFASLGASTHTHPQSDHHQSRRRPRRRSGRGHSDELTEGLSDMQQQKKALLQVVLLESGILFHSVFIGMALSVATGSNFIVLFIAILFHRR